jgi:2-methylaconitate cis-trans-isomerase PrpF
MQRAIPCTIMRGDTSKGLYFDTRDLPADPAARNRVLLAAIGSLDARQIDGVPSTAAPIPPDFLDVAGSACGALLPTGRLLDRVARSEVTCIDNGMPVVLMRAADLGKTGDETVDAPQVTAQRAALLRKLMRGEIYVPASLWEGLP